MTDSLLTAANRNNFNFVGNNSIDFILTDPPFNISKITNFHTYEKNKVHSYKFDNNSDINWDTYEHEVFLQMLNDWAFNWSRVLRKGGNFAIFCADAYISHLMDALANNGLQVKRLITWRKSNSVPVNRAYVPMSATEYIVVGVRKGKTPTFNANITVDNQLLDDKIIEATIVADKVSSIIYNNIRNTLSSIEIANNHVENISNNVGNVLASSADEILTKVQSMYKQDDNGKWYLQACVPNYIQYPLKSGKRIHPTEKPVGLLEYLIALYSRHGDTVLDGFAGSGSTGEAALHLDRNCVLIEREIKFYNNLISRLEVLTNNITIID